MPQYKASTGRYLTRQLFWEEYINLPFESRIDQRPPFSLYKDKHEDVINFGQAYITHRDPTGYKVTQELLNGDYSHWQVLLKCRWFLAAKEEWDREMDAAIQSDAIATLQEIARDGQPAQRMAAAKYLASKEYRKETAGKGRPKREDIDRAARDMAESERDIQDDLKRIIGGK